MLTIQDYRHLAEFHLAQLAQQCDDDLALPPL
jgi:hypothetical protein